MSPQVTAVIPNWNGGPRLARVLNDLSAQTHPLAGVIVVDNASTDESQNQPHAQLIRLPRNTGFAHAVNTGIQASRTEFVAILNNDVELPPTWLETLLAALPADKWFATGKILRASDPNILDATFDSVARSRCPWRCGSGKPDAPQWNDPRNIYFAPLTAALYRSELFRRTGLLDERFQSYLEDVDLGIRCALAGYEGLYVPRAVCHHWGSATLGMWHRETVRLQSRNQVYLAIKYPPTSWLSRSGWKVLAGQLLWGLLAARHLRLMPWLQGKWQGLRSRSQFDSASVRPAGLEQLFSREERRIGELQQADGFDLYWRLYFALT